MKIAAFNVKNLGRTKVRSRAVRTNLIKIVSRYSVVVMLEVKDRDGSAMNLFLEELNNYRGNIRRPFEMICSEPLGRGAQKEKFVFFYRGTEVMKIRSLQYTERNEDELAREPFIVEFLFPNTVVQKLVLIPVHSKPEDAERELQALHGVVQHVRRIWRTDNIMILGDFNASGPYLPPRRREAVRMSLAPYHLLIGDGVDTTTSNSNAYTYDRIVAHGAETAAAVVPRSAKAFDFQRAYGLSEAKARAVSDHYPVEVELKKN
ncbi:hypothetical protein Q5P01_001124 [Channa striata]|uniref:Deoxyribonuclease n=1 Tax=Channa striata TaxID=64152 RepID=A0AA88NK43_CHASR|nr:hypothetical protein Q5P01_001124 [Channa striata]